MFQFLFCLLASFAFAQSEVQSKSADEYSRRLRIVQDREYRIARDRFVAGRLSETERFHRMMTGFIKAHGGLKVESQCFVQQERCYSEGCQSDGHPYQVSFEQIRGQSFYVKACSVELGDGLACRLKNAVNGDTINWNLLHADCVTETLRAVQLRYPSGAKTASGRGR